MKILRYISILPRENGASMECPIFKKNRLNNTTYCLTCLYTYDTCSKTKMNVSDNSLKRTCIRVNPYMFTPLFETDHKIKFKQKFIYNSNV